MKKSHILCLIVCLIHCLTLPALAEQPVSLEGLSLPELEALRQAAEARISQLRFPDANGYIAIGDGEAYLRREDEHLNERVRLEGRIFSIRQGEQTNDYFLSLDGHPQRVFLLRYAPETDEPALLPGDPVSAYGIFRGRQAFNAADVLGSGAGLVDAELITLREKSTKPPAAAPYAATREDPAPLGITALYEGSYWSGYASFEIQLLSMSRGNTALKQAQKMSKYNITPLRSQEWYIVSLRVKALSAPGERAEIKNEDFHFVSYSGTEYRHRFLINNTQDLRTLYVGSEQTANIACLIDKGDEPLIVYQAESLTPLWFDAGRRAADPEGT